VKKTDTKEEKAKANYLRLFGSNLREIRLSKGLSQHELAYRSQIDKNQIGNIERGETNPTTYTLSLIIKALEIEPNELFGFEEYPPINVSV
jgi:transcriptional regulator with XRE-family HTH domain